MISARATFKQENNRWPNWIEHMGMMLRLAKEEGKIDDIQPYFDLIWKGDRHSVDGKMVGQIIYDLRYG